MRVLQPLVKSRSSSSGSRQLLLLRLGWRQPNLALTTSGFFLLGHLRCSEWRLMVFFPGFSSSFAFLASIPLIFLFLTQSTFSSEQLSLLRSGLALQQSRCASRGTLSCRGNAWRVASSTSQGPLKRKIMREKQSHGVVCKKTKCQNTTWKSYARKRSCTVHQ